MRIPTRLRTAAQIALGAVALAAIVTTPAVQPAFADGQPPAPATRTPAPGGPARTAWSDPRLINRGSTTYDSAGHFKLSYQIQNVGTATSKPILVYTYCSYQLPGFASQEVAAAPPQVVQPLASTKLSPMMTVDCGPRNAVLAVSARVLIVSEDDANTNNNQIVEKK